MAAGPGVAVGRAVPPRILEPLTLDPCGPQTRDRLVELLRTLRAPAGVPEADPVGCGKGKAVTVVVAPATHVDGFADLLVDVQPEDLAGERHRLIQLWSQELDV